MTVTVDVKTVVTSNLDGTAVPVDAGSHAMTFASDGATTVEKQIEVTDGQKGQTIAIDLDVEQARRRRVTVVVVAAGRDGRAADAGSMTDTFEDPTKRYYFIGLRYRGDVIPQFMLNIFVDGGKTLYSNSIGAEIDLRHDNFSLIPAITYTEYGTGDVVFAQKGKDPTDAGNWSVVNSSLKGLYASADLLWSEAASRTTGTSSTARASASGSSSAPSRTTGSSRRPAARSLPTNYTACQTTTSETSGLHPSCSTAADHQNASDQQGRRIPGAELGQRRLEAQHFPDGQLPADRAPLQADQARFEARFGLGFSLTGFWFGVSANYGLEKPAK